MILPQGHDLRLVSQPSEHWLDLVDLWFCHTTKELSATKLRVNESLCVHLAQLAARGQDPTLRHCEICEPREKITVPRRYGGAKEGTGSLFLNKKLLYNDHCEQMIAQLHDSELDQHAHHSNHSCLESKLSWKLRSDSISLGVLDLTIHRDLLNVEIDPAPTAAKPASSSAHLSPLRRQLQKLLPKEQLAPVRCRCCHRAIGEVVEGSDFCKLHKFALKATARWQAADTAPFNAFSAYTLLSSISQSVSLRSQMLGEQCFTIRRRVGAALTNSSASEVLPVWPCDPPTRKIPRCDSLQLTFMGYTAVHSSSLHQRALLHSLAETNGLWFFWLLYPHLLFGPASLPMIKCRVSETASESTELWLDSEPFEQLIEWIEGHGQDAAQLLDSRDRIVLLPALSRALLHLMI